MLWLPGTPYMVSRAGFVKCEVSSNTSSLANLPTIPLCRYLLYSSIAPSLKTNVYYSNKLNRFRYFKQSRMAIMHLSCLLYHFVPFLSNYCNAFKLLTTLFCPFFGPVREAQTVYCHIFSQFLP